MAIGTNTAFMFLYLIGIACLKMVLEQEILQVYLSQSLGVKSWLQSNRLRSLFSLINFEDLMLIITFWLEFTEKNPKKLFKNWPYQRFRGLNMLQKGSV